MADCARNVIDLCENDVGVTRDEVAAYYAAAIHYANEVTDWPAVNRAVIERWSESGLEYVKRRAWKMAEGRADG